MPDAAPIAPGTNGTAPQVRHTPAVALLAAVLLALLTTLGAAAPPVVGAPVAAAQHRDDGPRADDGCDAACAVRAATRNDPPSEHPAPRVPLLAPGQDTDTAAPAQGVRPPATTPHSPSSQPHTAHDRGRAPPVSSGT
ncbi:hypothetical protein [Streptomyces caeruleatus]|uniref:Uncharacterized protein n=1 Tax=Streptomyces caeruleatus TaxID=661399 RepID=A0A117RHP2_9ACTN|nr:hypothetical protein [Streptomyces caeruleatus]KUN91436.1 hypothetical protein AQJ67_42490 [Streptomyces caeruleatus]